MAAIKILVIPASLRSGSLNAKLAAAAVDELVRADVDVFRISLGDYPLPIYDGDLEANAGVPKHAINLKRMLAAHHGVLIVTPEYNSSLPPLLKNAIDWISRVEEPHESKGQVFRERPFAIAAASNGRLGGARCLQALRLVLSACRATVIPNQVTLAHASDAYDETDRLKHAADRDALISMARQLVAFAQQMK